MIYLDHNATTPLDPRVRAAMLPWLGELHGNPSSAHSAGRRARRAVDEAREQVATLIGGQASEIVFTASGTEANNMVIYSAARRCGYRGHLVSSILEHPSIRKTAEWAQQQTTHDRHSMAGGDISGGDIDGSDNMDAGGAMTGIELKPCVDGRIAPDQVAGALRADTRLVCSMLANNELGTIQPVSEIATLCRQHGVPVLCDAVQAIGKIPVDVAELGVDYLSLAGHKFHGPSGIAALWSRRDAELQPLLLGGAQEDQRRASTENVPAIVGLGAAAALATDELEARAAHLRALRDRFENGLAAIPDTVIHCADSTRLPHTSHIAFADLSGHELMLRLDDAGFAVSTGAACHAGRPQPSAAVVAMGASESEALASLRISFGMTNTLQEVSAFLPALAATVEGLRVQNRRARAAVRARSSAAK